MGFNRVFLATLLSGAMILGTSACSDRTGESGMKGTEPVDAISSGGQSSVSNKVSDSEGIGRRTVVDESGRTVVIPQNPKGDVKPREPLSKEESKVNQLKPDIEWQRIYDEHAPHGIRDLPFSSQAGPWVIENDVATAFAPNSQGLAVFGIHFLQSLTTGDVRAVKSMNAYCNDFSDSELQQNSKLISDLEKGVGIIPPGDDPEAHFVAYRIRSFGQSPDMASVEYVIDNAYGQSQPRLDVTLRNGEWTVNCKTPPKQEKLVPKKEITSANGWVLL